MNAQVIAVVNQKGGTGKSTTCANLGVGLAQAGKKVLVVDVVDLKVLGSEIPHSVRAKETSAEGKSIFAHDPGGKVAEAYGNLMREVLRLEKQRTKSRAGISL
ncbi:MAG: ParA family protein [Lachnospiraceae bacterium]|nr:ParA family protein [Lachnospiraceae bacterium]